MGPVDWRIYGWGECRCWVVGSQNDGIFPGMTAAQNGSRWSFAIDPSDATSNLANDMLRTCVVAGGTLES